MRSREPKLSFIAAHGNRGVKWEAYPPAGGRARVLVSNGMPTQPAQRVVVSCDLAAS